jgi:AmiR/NasT family two-component response regulator
VTETLGNRDDIDVLEAAGLDPSVAQVLRGLVREVENLRAAMEHRAVIEQAKGVLMHSMKIGPDAAFAVLVAASQRENVKLRDIATRIATAQEHLT